MARACSRLRALAREHPEVVGRVRRAPGRAHRRQAVPTPVQCAQQGRRDGATGTARRLAAARPSMSSQGRRPRASAAQRRARCAGRRSGRRPRRSPSGAVAQPGRQRPAAARPRRRTCVRSATVAGRAPSNSRRQTSSSGRVRGQVDGGVLAVVEEAFVASYVADLGVGDDDALETSWHQRRAHGMSVPPSAALINVDYDQCMSTLTADQVARRLGVKRETVYAYVSRGVLRAGAVGPGRAGSTPRRSRQLARRGRPRRASRRLTFEVELDTHLTELEPNGVRFRGQDATPAGGLDHLRAGRGAAVDRHVAGLVRPMGGGAARRPRGRAALRPHRLGRRAGRR